MKLNHFQSYGLKSVAKRESKKIRNGYPIVIWGNPSCMVSINKIMKSCQKSDNEKQLYFVFVSIAISTNCLNT